MLKNKKEKVKMSSPWVTFQHKVEEFFKHDPDIKININYEDNIINLYVENSAKADALMLLLPLEKEVLGTKVKINVIPANDVKATKADLFVDALEGNPIFADIFVAEGIYTNPITYVIFEDKIAQFYNDNLGDPHGNITTLYQDLAKEIFDVDGVNFCTKEIEED